MTQLCTVMVWHEGRLVREVLPVLLPDPSTLSEAEGSRIPGELSGLGKELAQQGLG